MNCQAGRTVAVFGPRRSLVICRARRPGGRACIRIPHARGGESKLVEILRDIAAEHSVPQGHLLAVALIRFLEQYEAGKVDLRPLPVPRLQSLKCKYRLELPEKWQ